MENRIEQDTTSKLQFLASPLIHCIILALLGIIIYSNTFHVPFLFDDEASISNNPLIQDLGNFFTSRVGYDDRPNRFIVYLTFALNYHFGGLNVAGYHLVNLVIHIVNALLVYGLARLTFRTPLFKKKNVEPGAAPVFSASTSAAETFIPFFAAALFVVHPVQTQSVTYIVQRLTSLTTLFYLASLVLHIRWRLASHAGARFLSPAVLPLWLMSLISAILAMKSKEIAFTLPMVVLLYEMAFFGWPGRKIVIALAPLMATTTIIPLTMVNILKPAAEILADAKTVTVAQSTLSRSEYLFTQFSVILTYLRLLVLPAGQNLDYDYPVNRSLLEPRAFLSLLVLVTLAGAGAYLWHRSSRSAEVSHPTGGCESTFVLSLSKHAKQSSMLLRLGAFGIFWFFITLSVESSVVPITDVIYEHRLYLPSVGLFIAAISLACAAIGRHSGRCEHVPPSSDSAELAQGAFPSSSTADMAQGVPPSANPGVAGQGVPPLTKGGQGGFACRLAIPLMALVLLLSGATYARNRVWQDGETLWRDVMAKSPSKARPYVNLGAIYGEQERVADSLREFETAIKLDPQHPEALSNLVLLYVSAGRIKEAEATCGTLMKLDPKLEFRVNLYKILALPDDGNPALRTVRDVCHISDKAVPKLGAL